MNSWPNFDQINTPSRLDRRDPSKVVEKTECRELLEVHGNVIDVKSICISHDLIRGGEWSFKNSGSRKILVQFHGSRSLAF